MGYNAQTAILLRGTEDWGSLSKDQHEQKVHDKIYGTPPLWRPLLLKNIKLWNCCLTKSFVEYRKEIKEIATKSWSNTGMPVVNHAAEETGYLCPTDDDDWYHPQIKHYLDEAFSDPQVDLVFWDCSRYFMSDFFDKSQRIVPTSWVDMNHYGSNGYAARKTVGSQVLNDHVVAKKEYPPDSKRVVHIDKPLSIWVRHMASTCILYTNRLDVHYFKKTVIPEITEEHRWAEEYVHNLVSSTKSIHPKIHIL